MPATLAALPKGHEFPPTTFTLSPEWVDAYIAAVGDAAIRDAGPGLVPPMAVAALSIRALIEASPLPPGTLHASQELVFHRSRPHRRGAHRRRTHRLSRRARWLGADERRLQRLFRRRARDDRPRDRHVPGGVVTMREGPHPLVPSPAAAGARGTPSRPSPGTSPRTRSPVTPRPAATTARCTSSPPSPRRRSSVARLPTACSSSPSSPRC